MVDVMEFAAIFSFGQQVMEDLLILVRRLYRLILPQIKDS